MNQKTFNQMQAYESFEDRFNYLKLDGKVCEETFGSKRYLNQDFYRSKEWRQFRNRIITRDEGCDLGVKDGKHEIRGTIYIHHIVPININDIINHSSKLMDENNVVCVSYDTHQAITYGDKTYLEKIVPIERKPGDTCLWKNTR